MNLNNLLELFFLTIQAGTDPKWGAPTTGRNLARIIHKFCLKVSNSLRIKKIGK